MPPHLKGDAMTDAMPGADAPQEEVVDDVSNEQGFPAEKWTAEMEGNGDYTLNFKDAGGADVTCVFKDTGNRKPQGDMMYAAFKGMVDTASDGKQYHAEATMDKVGEGEYEITSFVVYEF
jgi:hypothetical protein